MAVNKVDKNPPEHQNAFAVLVSELMLPFAVARSQADAQIAQLVPGGVGDLAFLQRRLQLCGRRASVSTLQWRRRCLQSDKFRPIVCYSVGRKGCREFLGHFFVVNCHCKVLDTAL
jgi:hypothetical protein